MDDTKAMESSAAGVILRCFLDYVERFEEITARARRRFETEDWQGVRADAIERLELYPRLVAEAIERLEEVLGGQVADRARWPRIKEEFTTRLEARDVFEIGESFYNSVTRRVFSTAGVDPAIEFVSTQFESPPSRPPQDLFHSYNPAGSARELAEALLTDFQFGVRFADIEREAAQVAAEFELAAIGEPGQFDRADVIRAVLFREQGAYVVGRLFCGPRLLPFVLAFRMHGGSVVLDAVLLDEDAISILFSFTRSHFHALTGRPYELVRFLASLMPRKRLSELYGAVGFHKHGKTQLYREILEHIEQTDERFGLAPGTPGLVMVVFTMPDLDLVFKVLRDRFGAPKTTSRRVVKEKYDLVFKHDRAGRLIDAHSFEHLKLDRGDFDEELLDVLVSECGGTVRTEGDLAVVIDHVYIERRVVPLDMHVRSAEDASAAVIDYGRAIRDLAASNVFPGDLLLKNFGLTRHGRVVFYDYDEISRLDEVVFRRLPEPEEGEETAETPLHGVGPNDVFPEEFRRFLGMPKPLRTVFESHHGELFDPGYWVGLQDRIAAGEIIEVLPYAEEERLG